MFSTNHTHTKKMQILSDVNQAWNDSYGDHSISQPIMDHKKKKVTFANGGDPISIQYMIAWKYAYSQARRGGWESVVADRYRFQRRIQESESSIGKIFSIELRQQKMNMLNQL